MTSSPRNTPPGTSPQFYATQTPLSTPPGSPAFYATAELSETPKEKSEIALERHPSLSKLKKVPNWTERAPSQLYDLTEQTRRADHGICGKKIYF